MPKRISVEPWACILWAGLLLMVPLKWLGAVLLAAAVHELSHLAMIRFLDGDIAEIRIRPGGAVIETGALDTLQELLCTLAGPAGSFVLMLLCKGLPRTAVCGVMQGLFNLLPIYPLDGGRALRCFVRLLARKKPCKHRRFNVQ